MFTKQKVIFLSIAFHFLLVHQVFALGEKVTEIADKVGDSVGIGTTAIEIDRNADIALKQLITSTPAAEKLAKSAPAINPC